MEARRVYRIYRELDLNLRIKPRRRLVREEPLPLGVQQLRDLSLGGQAWHTHQLYPACPAATECHCCTL